MTSPSSGKWTMPDYQTVETLGLRLEARPSDWRGKFPMLWRGLKRVPYLSGPNTGFHITVKPCTAEAKAYRIKVEWRIHALDGHFSLAFPENEPAVMVDKPGTWTPAKAWLGNARRIALQVNIDVVGPERKNSGLQSLVGFNTISSDTMALWVSTLIGSALITIGGGFLVGNLVKETLPTPLPVVIEQVEPTAVPVPSTPEVQSETDSNAP